MNAQSAVASGINGPNASPPNPPALTQQQQNRPHHTTRATRIADTTSALGYIELTFPVMLRYVDALHPFVVAVGEDFQTFTADIQHFFALDGAFGVRVEFAGTGESWGSPCLSSENIQAMFRVLKARGVVDFIRIVPAEDVF